MQRAIVQGALAPVLLVGMVGMGVLGAAPAGAGTPSHDGKAESKTQKAEPGKTGAAGSPGSPGGDGARTSSSSGGDAPGGNNGTIKITDWPATGGRGNVPRVACDFGVNFFGYDAGAQTAQLIFEGQSPTRSGVLLDRTTSWSTADRTGGGQLDMTYGPIDLTQAFAAAGLTPQKQGYHVKLTVHVTGSKGADTKYKVFWVEPCTTSATAVSPSSAGKPGAVKGKSTVVSPAGAAPVTAAGAPATGPGAVAAPAGVTAAPTLTGAAAADVLGETLAATAAANGSTRAAGTAAAPATAAAGATAGRVVAAGTQAGSAATSATPAAPAPASGTKVLGVSISRMAQLPFTGGVVKPLIVLATVLLGLGVAFRLLGRRRTA